ncbi:hypothetical protein GCM10023187_18890 [Nibrella viscosa]|uniref:LamG domain-containing protein n=1 Tax=Nibrella viscosa TaxID=1084524 RepID=A0ABP8KAT3_9BACT
MNIPLRHRQRYVLPVCLLVVFIVSCEEWDPPRRQFADITTGLVAYYPFSGTGQDVSGNQIHGQFMNGATFGVDRKDNSNSALFLDGIDDYFLIPDHPKLRPDVISISLWIKPRVVTSTCHIYNKATYADNTNQQYNAYIRPPYLQPPKSSGVELVADGSQDGSCALEQPIQDFVLHYDPVFRMNEWYHFVSVIDRKVGRIYLNGVEKQVNANLPDRPIDNCVGGTLRFGMHTGYVTDYNYFDGLMDDIRIYNRALSEAEIKALYQK